MIKIIISILILNNCATPTKPRKKVIPLIHNQEIRQLRSQSITAKPRGFFIWEIKFNQKSSILLGTIHAGVSSGKLPWVLMNRLRQSRLFLKETTIDEVEAFQKLQVKKFKQEGILQFGTLRRKMSAATWHKLVSDSLLDESDFMYLTPSAALAVYQNAIERRANFEGHRHFMDFELYSEAKRHGIKTGYLEGVKEFLQQRPGKTDQKSLTTEDLENFLSDDADVFKNEILKLNYQLAILYKRGNLKQIEKFALESKNYQDVFRRNRVWLPRLEREFKHGNAFVAVGVGHMIGQQSLLKLLKEKGFTIQRFP